MDNASFPPAPPADAESAIIWAYLQDGLDRIMLNLAQGISPEYYMNLYTAILNWSCISKPNTYLGRLSNREDIVKHLLAYFDTLTSSLNQTISSHPPGDSEPLKSYAEVWGRYKAGVKTINRLFSYHNRHFVQQRRSDANPRPTLTVAEIAFVQWRENILRPRKEEIVAALLSAIDRLRSGEEGDEELIKTVVDSIATLDIDPNGGKSLLFFKTTLEDQLLTSTTAYYASKKDGASPKEVEKWVEDEKERAERLLPKETAEKVLEAARQALA